MGVIGIDWFRARNVMRAGVVDLDNERVVVAIRGR